MNGMDSYVAKKSVIKAEIIWVLKHVMSGFSLGSCDAISDSFKEMFPDSKIANKFSLARTKCSYMITYSIAPYFASLLLEDIKHSDNFSISFDESLNSVTVNKQMDIVTTFWDKLNSKVEVPYLISIFLTRADDLLKAFQEATSKLALDKMLQMSMDGPSVNWKFYEKLIKSREKSELTGSINIGGCGLHVIHGTFKSGATLCEWDIVKILKGLYTIFYDTPARRSDYIDVTCSNSFPKSFCATKWIEDSNVAERAIEIWDNILKIFKFWESLPKHKRPSSKSYLIVQEATRYDMVLAKLHFFASVANLFKPFLTAYETRDPDVPFLYDDLHSLTREIMSWFVKPVVLKKGNTGAKLLEINLNNRQNILPFNKIHISFGAQKVTNEKIRKNAIRLSEIQILKEEFIIFLNILIGKLFERSPLCLIIARYASSLSPVSMKEKQDCCCNRFINLMLQLNELKKLSIKECDETIQEYKKFMLELLQELQSFNHMKKHNVDLIHSFSEQLS